jgi:hypothetical protein
MEDGVVDTILELSQIHIRGQKKPKNANVICESSLVIESRQHKMGWMADIPPLLASSVF